MKLAQSVAMAMFAAMLFTACAADNPQLAAKAPDASSVPLALSTSIPDKGISLYELDNGVRLKAGSRERDYDWVHATPRGILPILQTGDYDGDGHEELAIILNTGSGTGISIYDLYIVALDGPGGDTLETWHFDKDHYLRQLRQAIGFQTRDDGGILQGELIVGKEVTGLNMASFSLDELGPINPIPVLGNIVGFEADAEKWHASFGVGVSFEKAVNPQYIGWIHADVVFQGHDFQLANLRFEPDPEFVLRDP